MADVKDESIPGEDEDAAVPVDDEAAGTSDGARVVVKVVAGSAACVAKVVGADVVGAGVQAVEVADGVVMPMPSCRWR